MKDKDFSYKGSPNAAVVLLILAALGALVVFSVGFSG